MDFYRKTRVSMSFALSTNLNLAPVKPLCTNIWQGRTSLLRELLRKYAPGAVLLDLEDPTIMLASLDLPYGFSDVGTRIATVNVKDLLNQMQPTSKVARV